MPHVSRILQHLSFCNWFISFSITFSMFIHVVSWLEITSFWKMNRISLLYTSHFFIHVPMSKWVTFTYWVLWETLLWIWEPKYLFFSLLSIVWEYRPTGITTSSDSAIFHFLRSHHIIDSGCTILHSQYQCTGFQSFHTLTPCFFACF